jgi:hypothetical protein
MLRNLSIAACDGNSAFLSREISLFTFFNAIVVLRYDFFFFLRDFPAFFKLAATAIAIAFFFDFPFLTKAFTSTLF